MKLEVGDSVTIKKKKGHSIIVTEFYNTVFEVTNIRGSHISLNTPVYLSWIGSELNPIIKYDIYGRKLKRKTIR